MGGDLADTYPRFESLCAQAGDSVELVANHDSDSAIPTITSAMVKDSKSSVAVSSLTGKLPVLGVVVMPVSSRCCRTLLCDLKRQYQQSNGSTCPVCMQTLLNVQCGHTLDNAGLVQNGGYADRMEGADTGAGGRRPGARGACIPRKSCASVRGGCPGFLERIVPMKRVTCLAVLALTLAGCQSADASSAAEMVPQPAVTVAGAPGVAGAWSGELVTAHPAPEPVAVPAADPAPEGESIPDGWHCNGPAYQCRGAEAEREGEEARRDNLSDTPSVLHVTDRKRSATELSFVLRTEQLKPCGRRDGPTVSALAQDDMPSFHCAPILRFGHYLQSRQQSRALR